MTAAGKRSLRVAIAIGIFQSVLSSPAALRAEDAAFRPAAGVFPAPEHARSFRGELVFVDHANRRGSLRLYFDEDFSLSEAKLHHFAMLPYGVIRYRGAPADLRHIPLGTILYGRFYLPPDPKTSAVPVRPDGVAKEPAENHAVLLEDDPSFCLREGKSWKLKEVELDKGHGTLTASLERKPGGEGLGGEHTFTIDASTRIWRGRERLTIDDLVAEGLWPAAGKRPLEGRPAHLALAWHPDYRLQKFHLADIWLDDASLQRAAATQTALHNRMIRFHWMPAWIDKVEYGKFGQAIVTATLFGGMGDAVYADFTKGSAAEMIPAEATLRPYMGNTTSAGTITDVQKTDRNVPLGSSGIKVLLDTDLILEGIRPGRIVRIRAEPWVEKNPIVPFEEGIHVWLRGFEDRWPTPEIFSTLDR
jgi:hypothetical protein